MGKAHTLLERLVMHIYCFLFNHNVKLGLRLRKVCPSQTRHLAALSASPFPAFSCLIGSLDWLLNTHGKLWLVGTQAVTPKFDSDTAISTFWSICWHSCCVSSFSDHCEKHPTSSLRKGLMLAHIRGHNLSS